MRIQSESLIRYPQEAVYLAYRDKLPDVVRYIPDIKEIIVQSREEPEEGIVKLHNIWVPDREMPPGVGKIIKKDQLAWDDFATWRDAEWCVDWVTKLRMFTQSVKCSGRNSFIADGDHTRVILTGELQINLKDVPGVPRLLAGRIAPKLEKFIVSLITPNLKNVNASLQNFLDNEPKS